MGNQLVSSQSAEELTRLLSQESYIQDVELLESNKLYTVVKLTPDHYNYLFGKVHMKSKDIDIAPYKSRIESFVNRTKDKILPHLLISGFLDAQRFFIIFRQYIDRTLRKKLISPPFLNISEKIWIAYQCLTAVQQLHDDFLYHGDIKTENFLVTSWNWVFLSDFGNFYKPNYIVEGDLTTYNTFFSTSERPACYLPPEKFSSKEEEKNLTAEMDIFSLGCVIAEIFLDGQHLFTLPDLLSFKKSMLKTPSRLADIKNEKIAQMVSSMISLRPEDRKNINFYIRFFLTEVLSVEMQNLYSIVLQLTIDYNSSSPSERILELSKRFYSFNWPESESLVVLAEYITANIRSVQTAGEKVEGLNLLADVAVLISDDSKLHRVLPFFISILQEINEKPKVKVTCMNNIVQILLPIQKLTSRDTHLFNEYIWNAFSALIYEKNEYVKSELSRLLPFLARIGRRFFECSFFYSDSSLNYDKELAKFSEMFIRIFKDLIVHKPENQIHVELLSNFAELSSYLSQELVINNIIPMILGWLNKGDSYRVLILTQIPKLLEVVSAHNFFTQIFTCIEDGLNQHNELVVYRTLVIFSLSKKIEIHCLRKIITTVVHPSNWIRKTVLKILTDLSDELSPIDNFSILREILLDYIDLPSSSVELITRECIKNIHKSFTRFQLSRSSNTSNKLLRTLNETFKIRDLKINYPNIAQENWKVFETNFKPVKRFVPRSEETSGFIENLNIKGNLIGCFNEHEFSVTNIHVQEASQILVSASSDGVVKQWNLSALEPFKTLKSQEISSISQKVPNIKSLGSMNDTLYVAHEEGIHLVSLSKTISSYIPCPKLSKAISISDSLLSVITNQTTLSIFDLRYSEKASISTISGYYGPVSCLCGGPKGSTLALSTYSGALLIYDLRFTNTSMIYYHSGGLPILTMQNYDDHSLLLGSEDISLFDLKYGICSVLLSTNSSAVNPINPISAFTVPSFRETFDNEWIVKNCYSISHRTRKTFESPNIVRKLLSPCPPYVISAGNDSLVRCWDLNNPNRSCCIGQDPALKSRFKEYLFKDVEVIIQDQLISQNQMISNRGVKRKDFQEMPNHRKCSHTDTILDLALVTQPRSILLTASRDGTIKAWN